MYCVLIIIFVMGYRQNLEINLYLEVEVGDLYCFSFL